MTAPEELSRLPFNTGKVVIGSKYVVPVRGVEMSTTELRIQRALLGKPMTFMERIRYWFDYA
jgi:hypothetical protein